MQPNMGKRHMNGTRIRTGEMISEEKIKYDERQNNGIKLKRSKARQDRAQAKQK